MPLISVTSIMVMCRKYMIGTLLMTMLSHNVLTLSGRVLAGPEAMQPERGLSQSLTAGLEDRRSSCSQKVSFPIVTLLFI